MDQSPRNIIFQLRKSKSNCRSIIDKPKKKTKMYVLKLTNNIIEKQIIGKQMKKTLKTICCVTAALALVGCAATKLEPGAQKVLVSPNKPGKHCKYLGAITGNQGGFLTGSYTSNRNLETGAFNDMRNQAHRIGANYVQLVTNRAASSGSVSSYGNSQFGGSSGQTSVTSMGNAYYCKNL